MANFLSWEKYYKQKTKIDPIHARIEEEYGQAAARAIAKPTPELTVVAITYGEEMALWVSKQGGSRRDALILRSSSKIREPDTKSIIDNAFQQEMIRLAQDPKEEISPEDKEKKSAPKRPILPQYPEVYFCGCDVRIEIQNGTRDPTYLDDIVTIDYTETNNKSPIYGYASEMFDVVAKGTKIVQGNFAILLRPPSKKYVGGTHYLSQVLGSSSPDSFSYANHLGGVEGANIGYGFTIRMVYSTSFVSDGDTKIQDWANYTITEIKDVHITTSSRSATPSGEPIAEIYSFFAKRVVHKRLGVPETS